MAYGFRGPTKKAQARCEVLAALRVAQSELDLLLRSGRGSSGTPAALAYANVALGLAQEAGL